MTINGWNHIVISRTSSGPGTVYLNGASVATITQSATNSQNSRLWIGRDPFASSFFSGLIDDVRIYNRALSAAEIQAHYRTPHTWSVAAADANWGSRLSSRSTDVDSKWGTDGVSDKWLNIGDGNFGVVSRATPTAVGGSTEILQFRAEVGSSAFKPTGVYQSTVTLTAVTL